MFGNFCVTKITEEEVSGVFHPSMDDFPSRFVVIDKNKIALPLQVGNVLEMDYSQRAIAVQGYSHLRFHEVEVLVTEKKSYSSAVIAGSEEEAAELLRKKFRKDFDRAAMGCDETSLSRDVG